MPVIYGSDFGVNIPEEEFSNEVAQREYENYMRSLAQMYDEAMEGELNESMAQAYHDLMTGDYDEEFERALEQGSAVRYSGETPQFIPTPLTQDEYQDEMARDYDEEFDDEVLQEENENYMRSLHRRHAEEMGNAYNEAMYQECISAIDEEITEGVPDGYVRGIVQEYINATAGEVPAVSYEDHCTIPRTPQEEHNALREQWQYETERQQYEERWRRYERSVREYLETINRLNRDTVEVPPSRARESPPERRRRLIELAERYGGEEELNY